MKLVIEFLSTFFNFCYKLLGRGEAILFWGGTGTGKTTVTAACALHPDVQKLLNLREASGKGTTQPTETDITDSEDVPVDIVGYSAKITKITKSLCQDDNEFLGSILYAATKDYTKDPDDAKFHQKVAALYYNKVSNPANESLAYKLLHTGDEGAKKIIAILNDFRKDILKEIFEEVSTLPIKDDKREDEFVKILSKRSEIRSSIDDFWSNVVDLINASVNEMIAEIKNNDGEFRIDNSFYVELRNDEKHARLNEMLLRSEGGAKDYLLTDIRLLYRGDPNTLFSDANIPKQQCMVVNGKIIHCWRFIDPQGTFHETGVDTKYEVYRFKDLLAQFHCSRVIVILNAEISNLSKDSDRVLADVLTNLKRNTEFYFLVTHFDLSVKNRATKHVENRFDGRNASCGNDWEQLYQEERAEQEKRIQYFRDAVQSNSNNKKPIIVKVYYAAILSDPNSKMEDVLEAHGVTYRNAIKNLLHDILERKHLLGDRIQVSEEIYNAASINTDDLNEQKMTSVYTNLLECKGKLRLYAATVRACVRKWLKIGTEHISCVNDDNIWGFENIETRFVSNSRSSFMELKNRIIVDTSKGIINDDDAERFIKGFMTYLMDYQELGRTVIKLIGQDAMTNGFEPSNGDYQYEKFRDMLQYTQAHYFTGARVAIDGDIKERLDEALQICMRNYVDMYCTLVY